MKISIDGILGSARKLNAQRKLEEDSSKQKKNEIKDSVEIRARVNTRIDQIQRELKEIQSSLTKNQIVREGMDRLIKDFNRGFENKENILDEVKYENKRVLRDFVGENISKEILDSRNNKIQGLVHDDIVKLTKLSVEIENIMASDMASQDKIGDLMRNVENNLSGIDPGSVSKLSRLNADSVMRLLR